MEPFADQFHFREFLKEPAVKEPDQKASPTEKISEAARMIMEAANVVAFTGAGISVESGIPDFRSPNGLWATFDPAKYCSYNVFLTEPALFWEMAAVMVGMLRGTAPNPAHLALAELEAMGRLSAVVTQNVDSLHQEAGSTHVLEIHGSARTMTCVACGERESCGQLATTLAQGARVPCCKVCDGVMKMDVILFGEQLPEGVMEGAKQAVAAADVMLIVGTSLTVAPANRLRELCCSQGGKVIVVNIDLSSTEAGDVGLEGKAGLVLPRLLEECRKMASSRGRGVACSAL